MFFLLLGIAGYGEVLAKIVTSRRGLGDFEIVLPHFLQSDAIAQDSGLASTVFGNGGTGQFETMENILPALRGQAGKIDFLEFVDQRIGNIGRLFLGPLPFWHAELKRKLHSPLPRCTGYINSTLAAYHTDQTRPIRYDLP